MYGEVVAEALKELFKGLFEQFILHCTTFGTGNPTERECTRDLPMFHPTESTLFCFTILDSGTPIESH
jgi:hypothetical protein